MKSRLLRACIGILVLGAFTIVAGTSGCNNDPTAALGEVESGQFVYEPMAITADSTYLYVAYPRRHFIEKVEIATGTATLIAGADGQWGYMDDTGANARFNEPRGLLVNGRNLYVADSANHVIRRIHLTTRAVTTIAGDQTAPCRAMNWNPYDGTDLNSPDNPYNPASAYHADHAIGTGASLCSPHSMTLVGTDLYFTEYQGSQVVRKLDLNPLGTYSVTTVAGQPGHPGSVNGIRGGAQFYIPTGITSSAGFLYVADQYNSTIRKIEIATGEVSLFSGAPLDPGVANGTLSEARYRKPAGIAINGQYLYVADYEGHTIRRIDLENETVSTFAGTPDEAQEIDGELEEAYLRSPFDLVIQGASLFVSGGYGIRRIH